jgi:hypothetical protein
MSNFAATRNVAPPQVPPIPHYVPAPPAVYAPPPPLIQQGYGQQYQYGICGGRGRGGSRNRRYIGRAQYAPNNCGTVPPPAGIPPVPAAIPPPGIPPPAANLQQHQVQHNPAFSNVTKCFNNWNMHYTCGWDVPSWHNSQIL